VKAKSLWFMLVNAMQHANLTFSCITIDWFFYLFFIVTAIAWLSSVLVPKHFVNSKKGRNHTFIFSFFNL